MAKMNSSSDPSPELAELDAIKRLLVFGLLKGGATQREVAAALGVGQSTVSKMFPGGLPKPSRGKASE